MDNVSHTIIGMTLAEGVCQYLDKKSPARASGTRRGLVYAASIAGSNFPDLDALYQWITPGRVGYLLHHRGHTHTLLGILPEAAIVFFLLRWWMGRRGSASAFSRREWGVVALTAVAALCLHFFADYWNSYGIHPFYPWNRNWFYGDFVFIIEPFLWVTLGVAAMLNLRMAKVRAIGAALFALSPLVFVRMGAAPVATLVSLAAGGVVFGLLLRRLRAPARLGLAVAAAAFYLGLLQVGSLQARGRVQAVLEKISPPPRVLEIATFPHPASPRCWSVATVETGPDTDRFRYRVALVHFGEGSAQAECRHFQRYQMELPEPAGALSAEEGLHWVGALSGSVSELRRLKETDCRANAWFRFARFPFVSDGQLTDLRFASSGRKSFSSLDLYGPDPCPRFVPNWGFPRADLLDSRD